MCVCVCVCVCGGNVDEEGLWSTELTASLHYTLNVLYNDILLLWSQEWQSQYSVWTLTSCFINLSWLSPGTSEWFWWGLNGTCAQISVILKGKFTPKMICCSKSVCFSFFCGIFWEMFWYAFRWAGFLRSARSVGLMIFIFGWTIPWDGMQWLASMFSLVPYAVLRALQIKHVHSILIGTPIRWQNGKQLWHVVLTALTFKMSSLYRKKKVIQVWNDMKGEWK